MVLDKPNGVHLGIYTGHERLDEKCQNYITPLTIKSQTLTNEASFDIHVIYMVHGYSIYFSHLSEIKTIYLSFIFMYELIALSL